MFEQKMVCLFISSKRAEGTATTTKNIPLSQIKHLRPLQSLKRIDCDAVPDRKKLEEIIIKTAVNEGNEQETFYYIKGIVNGFHGMTSILKKYVTKEDINNFKRKMAERSHKEKSYILGKGK